MSKQDRIVGLLIGELVGPMPKLEDFARFGLTPKLNRHTLAMLALGPSLAMLHADLPLHECIALSEDPKIIEVGERLILITVLSLARGKKVSRQERMLVDLWAQQRINKHPRWHKERQSGRPGG